MPRAGIRPEDRSTGGLFTFEEGNGEIVNATVCNHSIPGFDPSCVFKLSIQRLDANWTPTADEPIDEFLNVGSVSKFHPGNAKSSDDNSDALEFGGAADCGDQDEAEGTCLLSLTGKGPNDSQNLKFKAKINIFADSCLAHGVKPGLFNGYAPNLIGMKAHFTQMMLPKSADSQAKRDPSCLIVGSGGQVAGGKIAQYPNAQTGGTGNGTTAGAIGSAPAAKGKAGTKGATPTPTAPPAAPPSDDISNIALQMLALISASSAGTTLTRQKLGSKMVVLLAKNQIPNAKLRPVQDLLKNDEWFVENAGELGWTVEGDEVTIPAA